MRTNWPCFLRPCVLILAMTAVDARPAVAQDRLCDSSFEDCRRILIDLIRAESRRIDVAFWFMSDSTYASEIIKRWQAGVDVRVIVDLRANEAHPGNAAVLDQLRNAKIPMRHKPSSGILHWKMMLFDAQNAVEFGGANYSPYTFVPVDPYRDYEDEIIYFVDGTESPAIVNSFRTRFENLWTDTTRYANYANISGPLTRHYGIFPKDPELNFPPYESYRNRSVDHYDAETHQIDVSMFRITDRAHSDAMIRAALRGIRVRLLTDETEYRNDERVWHAWNIDRLYMAGLTAKRAGLPGIDIRLDAHYNVMHQKSVQLYSQGMSIFGSSNWTSPSAGGDLSTQEEHNYFTTRVPFFNWIEDQFNRKWNSTNPVGAIESKPFVPLRPNTPAPVSPVNGAGGLATTVSLIWYGGPWGHLYDIYLGTSSSTLLPVAVDVALGPSLSTTDYQNYVLGGLNGGTTYYWRVVSKTMARQERTSATWSFTTGGSPSPRPGLPAPWAGVDIGATVRGNASESGGTFTVQGAGADIWSNADAFHFVYRTLTGDGTITARVATQQNTNAWAKSGVMMRESLTLDAPHASMFVTPGKGISFQRRVWAGGESTGTTTGGVTAPYWVRLVRQGNTFTAYASPNGQTWTRIGAESILMASTIYVGLPVSSHDADVLNTTAFDSVSVGGGGTPGDTTPPTVSISQPANGAQVSGTVTVTANASDNVGVTRVELWVDGALRAGDTSAPYAFSWNSATVADGGHSLQARAYDAAGNAGSSSTIGVVVANGGGGELPPPWTHADVGSVGAAGTASASGGTITVQGAGADIWGTTDAFHYAYQPLGGDGEIVARVASVQNVDQWTKAGVMIRETLSAGSKHALMLVSPGKGLAFQRRPSTNGGSTHTSGGSGTAPVWVRLVRAGSTISAYRSSNGTTWTFVGNDTITMSGTVLVGLAVSSHVPGTLASASFDNVAVIPKGLPSPWAGRDIGATAVAGSAGEAGGTFTVAGSGADIWGGADAFHYVYRPFTGDGEIVARVATLQNVNQWSKAGVMLRETLDPGSPHASMFVSPSKGLAFQRRVTAGGDTTHTSGGSGTAPSWVRLVRSGTSFTAYVSTDGSAWTLVGTETIGMAATIYAGLAVTSHDNTRLCTATLDGVVVGGGS